MLESGLVKFVVGDGRKGWAEKAKDGEEGTAWDVIHVGASAKKVHPELLDQLKAPGWSVDFMSTRCDRCADKSSMFIPVNDDDEGYAQFVWKIAKDQHGKVTSDKLFGVRYVPLTDAPAKV